MNILKWYGGKLMLLKDILPLPTHKIYLEVFGGSATLLLNKVPSKIEVYNDINSRLVNFWKVLKDNWFALKLRARLEIDSRQLLMSNYHPAKVKKMENIKVKGIFTL